MTLVALLAAGSAPAPGAPAETPRRPDPPPTLAEAKRQVRLMDDIYISGVLAAHKMYVRDPGVPSAIAWAKQVFRGVHGKNWPEARIFDGTGRPLNPENDPVDRFERDAITAFRSGKRSLERVEGNALRYASVIRVSDEGCIKCHVRAKPDDLLGGVSYRALFTPGRK